MDSREDAAASKIQALHRGNQARKSVDAKRQREAAAATKIQSLQRGRQSRRNVQDIRKNLELVTMPPRQQTNTFVDLKVSLPAFRQRLKTWDSLVESLSSCELATGTKLDYERMLYSTEQAPDSYANAFSRKVFEQVLSYDECRVRARKLRAQHEAIEAAKPPPAPEMTRGADAEEDDVTSPSKTKKQLRDEAAQRKADRERLMTVVQCEHDALCKLSKLENVLKLHSLRIPFSN